MQNFKQVAVDQTNLDRRTFAVKKYIEDSLVNLTPYLKKTPPQITINGDFLVPMLEQRNLDCSGSNAGALERDKILLAIY